MHESLPLPQQGEAREAGSDDQLLLNNDILRRIGTVFNRTFSVSAAGFRRSAEESSVVRREVPKGSIRVGGPIYEVRQRPARSMAASKSTRP